MTNEHQTTSGLDRIPLPAFILNAQGKVVALNAPAEHAFGQTASSLVGKKGWGLLGDELLVRNPFLGTVGGKTVARLGEARYEILTSPKTNEEGDVVEVTYVLAPTVDTDKLAVVDAIDRWNARIEFSMTGEILDANDNFLRILGYDLSEIKGMHHGIFVTPEERASIAYRDFWATLNRGQFVAGEFKRRRKGGEEIHIQASYNPILDAAGKPVRVVKLATEGSSQVEARAKAQTIQSVVENSPNPTMVCDRDLRITYLNRVATEKLSLLQQFLPIPVQQMLGQSIDVFHKHPEHQRKFLQDPRNLPHTAKIKLGPETLKLQVYAIRDESGEYQGPALAWEIITDQVALEKRAVGIVRDALAKVAVGNVDVRIEEEFAGELNVMRDDVNAIAAVLRNFNATMTSLANAARAGRLSERADVTSFKGAYAEIIEGVNNTLDAILTPVSDIRGKLGLVATGDLSAYVEGEYEGDHAELKNALNGSLDGLNDLLGQISSAANQIATSSTQVATAAQDLSQGASEQAATVQEISAQMGQITTQTQQNAENASQANQLAVAARDGARAGDVRMNEMLIAMREIEEASNSISKIIKVIDEIAFQTNLLALNAAVEAARAGAHGKGFAVVAEEVRNLAARSAKAAKETTEMIEGSIKKVALGTGIARETAAALGAIVKDVGKVSDLVAEIAAASNEQAEGINQINSGLEQVNEVTQRNTATAEESAASAQETSGQIGEMQRMVSRFKLRERGDAAGLPAGMTPEMMAVVQAYVERLLGARAPAAGQGSLPRKAAMAPPAPRGGRADPAHIISLDSGNFGKY